MKSFVTVFIILLITQTVSAAATPDDRYIESVIKSRIESSVNQAIVVGIVDSSGRRIISHGTFNRDDSREVDGNTLFEIGSVTKVFTSLILAAMAEKGDLGLDDPIKHYLPDSVDVPEKNSVEITFSHLASHTSGLPLWPTNIIDDYTAELLYEFLSGYELIREPGTLSEYSNLGAGLLGHILSLKTGLSSEELFIERVCKPLNLADTRITIEGALYDRFPTGHDMQGNQVEYSDVSKNVLFLAAGALRSTANDLLTFLEANLGYVDNDLYSATLNTHIPRADVNPPILSTGLAWFIQRQYNSEILWHTGASEGYRSFIGFDKESGIGVVVLSNSANDIQDIGMHLLNENYELAVSHPEIDLTAEILDGYCGMYEFVKGVYATVSRKSDELWVQFTGEPELRIYPYTEKNFFYKTINAEISFETSGDNIVTAMLYRQSGTDYTVKKLGVTDISPVPAGILESYTGQYQHQEIDEYIFTVEKNGDSLFGYPPDSRSMEFYPLSDTEFLIDEWNVVITFNHDVDGYVESFTLFIGGGYAVLNKMDMTSVSENGKKPEENTLFDNRPNPFNPSTVIEYRLAKPSHVMLTVFTLSGQKVATLVDKHMSAGNHSAVFNGSGLASGVYIYKLDAEGFTKNGKMTLVK